ncbi:ATP-grasp domain-containing protein [Ideonella sp. YS5]
MLGEVDRRIFGEAGQPVFANPSFLRRSFTGRVFASPSDFMYLGATSRRQEVWCSEVVSWRSEYRVYVVENDIVGIHHYDGASDAMPNMTTALLMVS